MSNHDWSSFKVEIPLEFPDDRIKDYWLSQEQLEKWFLRLAEFKTSDGSLRKSSERIHPGDSYRWQWYGWSEDIVETGIILSPNSGEFLRFKFGKAGIVAVSIREKNGKKILHLAQENIPLDEDSKMNYYVGCKTGWTFYLLNLKSVLMGGPDLRNKAADLSMD